MGATSLTHATAIPSVTDIDGVVLTPLRIIPSPKGDVLHGIKSQDPGFFGFGEAYFSTVMSGVVKGWKRHKRMTLNLVVPAGEISFSLLDRRVSDPGLMRTVTLGRNNYYRLTIPADIWVSFVGLSSGLNLLLNVANLAHDPEEAENVEPGTLGLPAAAECFPFLQQASKN